MRRSILGGGGSTPLTIDSNGNAAGPVVVKDRPANDAALFLDTEGVTALAASASQDTGDVSSYSRGILEVSGSGTVSIFGLIDGAEVTTDELLVEDAGAPGVPTTISATSLGAGTYYIKNLACKNLRFTETSTTDTVTVVMALKA